MKIYLSPILCFAALVTLLAAFNTGARATKTPPAVLPTLPPTITLKPSATTTMAPSAVPGLTPMAGASWSGHSGWPGVAVADRL